MLFMRSLRRVHFYGGREMPDPIPRDGSIEPDSVRSYFGRIARRYDLANRILSGGVDVLWRLRAVEKVRCWEPKRILDLATGSGDLALLLERACPEAMLVGADFCEPMLHVAREKGVRRLVVADALQLPFVSGAFDAVTVAFGLRNMASWSGALQEMRRVVVAGGHLMVLDFGLPQPPWLGVYRWYLHRVLPRLARWVTGEQSAYDYLADSIEAFPSGRAMCALLEAQGWREAEWEPLLGGIAAIYTAKRG
jgi:demethylmenaquinone methyltransferase/2-methoxy-6-polyprenyl-1,4-benzoquinol methylase